MGSEMCIRDRLEAVLLLKGALPAPSNTPPGPEDLLAVEAAAADPLVSDRRAVRTRVDMDVV